MCRRGRLNDIPLGYGIAVYKFRRNLLKACLSQHTMRFALIVAFDIRDFDLSTHKPGTYHYHNRRILIYLLTCFRLLLRNRSFLVLVGFLPLSNPKTKPHPVQLFLCFFFRLPDHIGNLYLLLFCRLVFQFGREFEQSRSLPDYKNQYEHDDDRYHNRQNLHHLVHARVHIVGIPAPPSA